MEPTVITQFQDLGAAAVLGLAAAGSATGIAAAGQAAVGAWKKGFVRNKPAPFATMLIFIGAPISQTFYGMILMNQMMGMVHKGLFVWFVGIFCGMAIGLSAFGQGKIGAAAADALGESDKGLANYVSAIGIIESVAIFVMVFGMMLMGKF